LLTTELEHRDIQQCQHQPNRVAPLAPASNPAAPTPKKPLTYEHWLIKFVTHARNAA